MPEYVPDESRLSISAGLSRTVLLTSTLLRPWFHWVASTGTVAKGDPIACSSYDKSGAPDGTVCMGMVCTWLLGVSCALTPYKIPPNGMY